MANPALQAIRNIERKYDIERAKKTQARDVNQNAILTLLKLDHDERRDDLRTARDELKGVERDIDRLTIQRDNITEQWSSLFGGDTPYSSSANDVNQSSAGQKVYADNIDKYNNLIIPEAIKDRDALRTDIRKITSDIAKGNKLNKSLEYISYKGGSNPDLYDSDDFTPEKISKETGISKELVAKYIQSNPIQFGERSLEKLNNQLASIEYKTEQMEDSISGKEEVDKYKSIAERVTNANTFQAVGVQVGNMTPDMSDKDKKAVESSISSLPIASVLVPRNYIKQDPNMSQEQFEEAKSNAKFKFTYDFYNVANSFKTRNPNYAGMNLILRRLEDNVESMSIANQKIVKKEIQKSLNINMDSIDELYHPDYRQTFFAYEDMFIDHWKQENLKNKSNVSWDSWFKKNQKKIAQVLLLEFPFMSKRDFLTQEHIKILETKKAEEMYSKYIKTSRVQFNKKMNDIKTILKKKR